jgi:hypothetical protein
VHIRLLFYMAAEWGYCLVAEMTVTWQGCAVLIQGLTVNRLLLTKSTCLPGRIPEVHVQCTWDVVDSFLLMEHW